MTEERYKELEHSDARPLTYLERNVGWHWCNEFDGLLVGPGMPELRGCKCLDQSHPVYQTAPPLEPDPPEAKPF